MVVNMILYGPRDEHMANASCYNETHANRFHNQGRDEMWSYGENHHPCEKLSYGLKALDKLCQGQRPVSSFGLSQHTKHKIINLWTFGLNLSSKLQINNERTNTLVAQSCVLSDA